MALEEYNVASVIASAVVEEVVKAHLPQMLPR